MTARRGRDRPRSEVEVNLLRALMRYGQQSRADLSRRLSVQRSTATKIVQRLLASGTIRLVHDDQDAGSAKGVGRPGQRLDLAPDHIHFLGAEVGVGYVRALRLDLCGNVRRTETCRILSTDQSPEHTTKVCAALVEKCAEGAPPLGGLAIAVPGIVRSDGLVMRAPRLDWHNVQFGDLINHSLPQFEPISLQNDANAFAMGEMIQNGVGEDELALFMYFVSGVGGAILDRGKFLFGHAGLAGEIGHIFVIQGHSSGSGSIERLEDVAGSDAFFELYQRFGGTLGSLDEVFIEYEAGAEPAMRAIEDWVSAVAQAMSTLTSILNPTLVMIGGTLAPLAEQYRHELSEHVATLSMQGTVVPKIEISHLGANAVALGCAEIMRLQYLEGPDDPLDSIAQR